MVVVGTNELNYCTAVEFTMGNASDLEMLDVEQVPIGPRTHSPTTNQEAPGEVKYLER